MIRSIAALRAASDEELIAEHDRAAEHTSVGTDYYVEELVRRDLGRQAAASHKLAHAALWLTVANTILALAAVVVAVVL